MPPPSAIRESLITEALCVAIVLALIGLGMVVSIRARVRARRRAMRLRDGLCRDCGYPVAGAGKPCPECGKVQGGGADAGR